MWKCSPNTDAGCRAPGLNTVSPIAPPPLPG